MQLWDIIAPVDLTAFARVVPDDLPNNLNQYLPDRLIPGVKSRVARRQRTNTTAMYRAWNAETPIGKRPETVSVTEVNLPPLGQKLILTEWDRLWLEYASGAPSAVGEMLQSIYDDTESNVRAIRNRLELARGDLLTDGKFTLTAENGLTLEADYQLAGSHKPTAGTLWEAAGATPLANEITWSRLMQTDGAGRPVAAIGNARITAALLASDEYRAAFWGGNAGSQPNLNLEQLNTVRRANGLAPYVEYDHQVDVEGVTTRVIPETKLILVGDNLGETQFGITAESLELVQSNAVDFTTTDAPGIFAAAYKIPDPVTGISKANATAMPVLADINALVSATVLS